MTTFSEMITRIVSDLQQAGFVKEADDLRHLAGLALDQSLPKRTRTDALAQIQMRCHVKWFGDLYLPHLSQEDWWGIIEKLGKSTKNLMRFV
jgi:hypothetical protein